MKTNFIFIKKETNKYARKQTNIKNHESWSKEPLFVRQLG